MTNSRQLWDKIIARIEKKRVVHVKRSDKARSLGFVGVAECEQGRAEGLTIAKGIIDEMRDKNHE